MTITARFVKQWRVSATEASFSMSTSNLLTNTEPNLLTDTDTLNMMMGHYDEAIIKMVQGNPGAVIALSEMIKLNLKQDPNITCYLLPWLNNHGIRGDGIYHMYKYAAGGNPIKALSCWYGVGRGVIDFGELKQAIENKTLLITDEKLNEIIKEAPELATAPSPAPRKGWKQRFLEALGL